MNFTRAFSFLKACSQQSVVLPHPEAPMYSFLHSGQSESGNDFVKGSGRFIVLWLVAGCAAGDTRVFSSAVSAAHPASRLGAKSLARKAKCVDVADGELASVGGPLPKPPPRLPQKIPHSMSCDYAAMASAWSVTIGSTITMANCSARWLAMSFSKTWSNAWR